MNSDSPSPAAGTPVAPSTTSPQAPAAPIITFLEQAPPAPAPAVARPAPVKIQKAKKNKAPGVAAKV
jgi:hypothetical protein